MNAPRNLVNIKEASRLTGICVSRLYKLTMPKVSGVPHYKIGGSVRFSPEELEDWLTDQRRPTQTERENALYGRLKAEGNNLYPEGLNARRIEKEWAKNENYNAITEAGRERKRFQKLNAQELSNRQ